jgi:hypothetical protein
MFSWTDIEVRQIEHEQRVQRIEQTYWKQMEAPAAIGDRWQWRAMNTVGGWLVKWGSRLQTHVEQARQVVHSSPLALESNGNPCEG